MLGPHRASLTHLRLSESAWESRRLQETQADSITGTPSSRDMGRTFVLKIIANNGVGGAASQEFKIKVR